MPPVKRARCYQGVCVFRYADDTSSAHNINLCGASAPNETPSRMEETVDRAPGLSVRLKLTLSYAGFVLLAGALLLAAVWLFLLRYVPRGETVTVHHQQVLITPGRGDLLRHFAPAAAILLAFLLVFGLLGGWLLAS